MRLLFMGTPEWAIPTLQALVDSDHEVCGVLTQPDRPAGRKKQMLASPVKQWAQEHGLPIFTRRASSRNLKEASSGKHQAASDKQQA